ncbi:hypothetical protein L6R52_12435 [Myxococcota bacterium]|nr:hypothetical protein [Myxococcota bacterium]
MAIPPEPLEEVLEHTDAAVLGEVTRIVEEDAQAPLPTSSEGATSLPGDLAKQVVELRVKEVLFGRLADRGTTVLAVKPAGDYTLIPGAHGPFLLCAGDAPDAPCTIVGRYGPDSYRTADVRQQARKLGKR